MATTAKQSTTSNSSASSATVSLQATHQQHYQHTTSQINITTTSSSTTHRSQSRSVSPSKAIQLNNNNNNNQYSSHNNQTEQDIEIIARQISDHAEAIYQTWKARGLKPTEILTCHSVNSDAFDKTLTPSVRSVSVSSSRRSESPSSRRSESPQLQQRIVDTINELKNGSNHIDNTQTIPITNAATMSNSNLKKLVSTFVNEDKARQQQHQQQQTTRKTNILTSGTIKDALKKFENIDGSSAPNVRPNYLKYNSNNTSKSTNNNGSSISTVNAPPNVTIKTIAQRDKSPKLQLDQPQNDQLQSQSSHSFDGTKLNKNVPDVLINTIEQDKLTKSSASITTKSLNNNSNRSASISATSTATTAAPITPVKVKKPETPAKPANLLNHQPAWSLKNRLKPIENGSTTTSNGTSSVKAKTSEKTGEPSVKSASATPATAAYENDIQSVKLVKQNCQNSANSKSNDLMDEVLMEEERLINALKTGTVLNNDKVLPEVITSTLTNTNSNNNLNNNNNTTNNNNSSTMTNVKIVTANASAEQTAQPQPQQRNNWNGAATPKSAPIDLMKPISDTASNEIDGVQLKFTKTRTRNDAAVPHPTAKDGAAKAASSVPAVRPFLTRGSVAERVLMFEKCPEIKMFRLATKETNKLPVNTTIIFYFFHSFKLKPCKSRFAIYF